MATTLEELTNLTLGSLLEGVRERCGGYEMLDHWTQGEFHHDIVLRVLDPAALPGQILVVATNCNGGVKELLCFGERPTRTALWHSRSPESVEFSGDLPPLLGRVKTVHWLDPQELLGPDARSELREEFRQRQAGGGWEIAGKKPDEE